MKRTISAITRWEVGHPMPVAGIVFLEKGQRVRARRLTPIAAAPHLYRALSEHPRLVQNRNEMRALLFRTACRLTRSLPAWELELTIDGDFSDLLVEATD